MRELLDDTRNHESYLHTRYFTALNGLRAISVIAVVWHHTAGQGYDGSSLLAQGHLGVDFFFAISGFLITTLLLRERRASTHVSLRNFYIRRTLRIFPLYYAVLVVYVLLTLLTRRGTPDGQAFFENLPAFATYTSNWFVELTPDTNVIFYFAWSLATEEQFYLLWPPLLALVLAVAATRGRLAAPLAVLAALATVSVTASHAPGGDQLWLTILRSISLPILLGAAGALLLDDRRGFRLLAPALGATATAPVLCIILVSTIAAGAPVEIVQTLMVLIVMACCIRENRVLTPALTLRPLAWVGTVSYGVYLMHMLAANAVEPLVGQSGLIEFLAALALVTVAASFSFQFFESPILRFKDRVAGSRHAGRTAPRTRVPEASNPEVSNPELSNRVTGDGS